MKKSDLPVFAGILLLSAGVVGSVLMAGASSDKLNLWDGKIRGEEDALVSLQSLASSLKDLDAAELGYVLTGKESYWQPYLKSQVAVQPLLNRLAGDAAADRLPPEQVRMLTRFAQAKVSETRSVMTARKEESFEAAFALINKDTGKQLIDGARLEIDTMARMVETRLRNLRPAKAAALKQRSGAQGLQVIFSLLCLSVTLRVVIRGVKRRRNLVLALRQGNVLAAAFASVGDGILLADRQARIVFANEEAIRLTGWTLAEMLRSPCAGVVRCVHALSRKQDECAVDQALATGAVVRLRENHVLIRKDGSEIPVELCAAPIRERGSSPYGAVIVLRDAEASAGANETLRRSKEDLEKTNRAKDLFLATLSHELRTPLAPVLATLSSWEGYEDLPRIISSELPMLRRNIETEARIIDDLLDLTRVIHGTLSLRRHRVNIHEMLRLTVQTYAREIKARDIRFLLQLDGRDGWVMGDQVRLQQVLWNLIGNAVKFTPAEGEIRVTSRSRGDGRMVIEIQDTGIGLSASTLQRLFKPFQQGLEERSKDYGGLGLGLAIAKAVVEAHQGELSARSDGPGQGSCFTLVLPSVAADSPIQEPAPACREAEGREPAHLKLLLVEDHEDTANVMVTLLRGVGHSVQVQSRVEDAVCAVRSEAFDLIISDLGLPDGSGIDFVRRLREFSQTPAIALTGYGTEHDLAECREAGFNAHLTKPLSFDLLRKEIRRVLEQ